MKKIPFDSHGKVSVIENSSARPDAARTAADPVKVQDASLLDGYQSLFASTVRTEDILAVARAMDRVGFHSIEIWGGVTFATAHAQLNEDPWERLRVLKKGFGRTPLSMPLWGQNLVGHRSYPDGVVEAFVDRACANGIDIFRLFDATDDFRTFATAAEAIKKNKKHFQGSFCCSLCKIDSCLEKARQLEEMGADTICIKDMAGIMAPYDAYNLVAALKSRTKVPIHLHTRFSSGMGDLSLLKAVEAGVDIVDTCMAPLAYRNSHPAVEPLVASLRGTNRDPGFDLELLAEIDAELDKQAAKYIKCADQTRYSVIDVDAVLHRTSGATTPDQSLRDYPRGQHPTNVHPGDAPALELEKARQEIGNLAKDMDDLLIYALFPVTGKRFLRIKYGLEKLSVDWPEASGILTPLSGGPARVFDIDVEGQRFRVQVKEVEAKPGATPTRPTAPGAALEAHAARQPAVRGSPSVDAAPAAQPQAATPAAAPTAPAPAAGQKPEIIKAPIAGTIAELHKKAGEKVKKGDSLMILEAMKMRNYIESAIDGEIVEYRVTQGDTVAKGQVLCVIRPA
jgi:pyruvate/oxaloacetate carboxyltransferase/biotin carboxyl carrier protein